MKKSPRSKTRNRRVSGDGTAKPRRPPLDPESRKARNRTILLLSLLALVNAWVFLWRGEGSISGLGKLGPAAIGHRSGPLPPLAEAPVDACGGDPVRIFEGLEDLIRLELSLSGGYTVRLALLRLGVEGEEIDRIEAAIRSKVDLGLLGGSGAPLRVAVDRAGSVHALEIELAEGRVLQACRSAEESEGFAVRNLQHPLRTDVVVVGLELGRDADLLSAVQDVGEKPELAALTADVLAYDIDFMTEARPGDEIQVMVEKRWLGKRFHRYGSVLAVRFRGAAARVSYYWYKPEGRAPTYFDASGKPLVRAMRRSPLAFYPVNPEARGLLPPSIEVLEGRVGAVYRVPEGAPVVALGDGVVRAADKTLEQGNFIDLELSDGTVVRYSHLHRFIGELEPGTPVRRGRVLALAGHTGQTPYDRVRLELWAEEDGAMKTIDPMTPRAEGTLRPIRVGEPVPEDQLERFEADLAPRRKALRMVR